jgi:hypothetical protein
MSGRRSFDSGVEAHPFGYHGVLLAVPMSLVLWLIIIRILVA